VDLSKSENSQDSEDFGVEFVDTSDSDNKGKFGLGGDVNLSGKFRLSPCSGFCLVGALVLSLILLGFLEYQLSSLLVIGLSLGSELQQSGRNLSISLFFLSLALGFGWNYFLSWHNHKQINYIRY
jgi:hypothetical protein